VDPVHVHPLACFSFGRGETGGQLKEGSLSAGKKTKTNDNHFGFGYFGEKLQRVPGGVSSRGSGNRRGGGGTKDNGMTTTERRDGVSESPCVINNNKKAFRNHNRRSGIYGLLAWIYSSWRLESESYPAAILNPLPSLLL